MSYVLTLIAPPGRLVPSLIAEARALLGPTTQDPVWLGPEEACDLFFESDEVGGVRQAVESRLADHQVDLALQPVDGRRKKLLVSDLESTLIRNEMLDEVADFLGIKAKIEEITSQAMHGHLDFSESLRRRTALLTNTSMSVFERALERLEFNPGAGVLMATLAAHGVKTGVVTGGFDFFAEHARRRLGCDRQHSNDVIVDGDRLTGEAKEPILDSAAKRRILEAWCAELGCVPQDAVAIGDGANDLHMLAAAGLGVAYRAKPKVAAEARFNVHHGDLTAVLFMQGYARRSWATWNDPGA